MKKSSKRGFLSGFKARLQSNRLGELLVLDGFISNQELKQALHASKAARQPLGKFLVDQKLVPVEVIRQTLIEQFSLRFITAAVTIFISFASFGASKQARASSLKDVPSLMQVANAAFSPMEQYPAIFGSQEKQSTNLTAFTKWSGMFSRFERSFSKPADSDVINDLKARLDNIKGQSIYVMASQVNDLMNNTRYITDSKNYGQTDYWATPVEFMNRGGDCEDFAIAKYTALRALGVPEERLRVVILQDMEKNIPHAILVAYTEKGPMILDNQIKSMVSANSVSHYKPIFSINREAWWLHSKPKASVTVIASSSK